MGDRSAKPSSARRVAHGTPFHSVPCRQHVARRRLGLVAGSVAAAAVLLVTTTGGTAHAAIVPTVGLGTAANYSVLGGSTVTNTNASTLDQSLGLSPGTDITGFPPGIVNAPGTIDNTNAAAAQAQSDLTTAYVDAAARPVNATTTSDLVSLQLGAGVYSGPSHSPLLLSGPLVLDGAGDASSVFIFQTDSTLITASASTITLINGAQECNVFWQVGSSATLGSGSVFVGNILALDSITLNNSVTVHGRALARNAAVTMDNDVFRSPTCDTTTGVTTTTAVTTTTIDSTATTAVAGSDTTAPATPVGGAGDVGGTGGGIGGSGAAGGDVGLDSTSSVPDFIVTLPRTGSGSAGETALAASGLLIIGIGAIALARRRQQIS